MHQKKIISLLAAIIIPLAGISTDIYLPSLPALARHFSVSPELVQLTITAYAVGAGLMQLIAGPVSDARGRKKLFVMALLVQALSVTGILWSPTVIWMLICRFIQGSGAAFVAVPARAILTDVFEGEALKKQLNHAAIAFSVGPIVAPFIGGYLQHYMGWRASFFFILIYIVIALTLVLFLYKETLINKYAFSVSHLWHNYRVIISNHHFMLGALFTSLLIAANMFFNVAGPFIIQVSLGRSALLFGQLALYVGLAWFLGSVTNRILFRIRASIKIITALLLVILVSSVMFIMSLKGGLSLTLFVVPIILIIFLCGGAFSSMVADCLTLFKTMFASVNALFFSVVWLGVSGFSALAACLRSHTLVPFAAALWVIGLIGLCLYSLFLWQASKQSRG